MATGSALPSWQRALIVLAGTAVAVVVVVCLYWAQAVLIPVALAIFLSFVLSPAVTGLQRLRLGRTPAVLVVVAAAALGLGGTAWLVTSQCTGLLRELPAHRDNITAKVRALREQVQGSGDLDQLLQEVEAEWSGAPNAAAAAPRENSADARAAVVVQP